MAYAKLQSSIITSTVWAECDTTRIVWITMLALADRNGYVAASVPGLAHVARVARDAVERALHTLSSPDADSRNQDFEGRRIQVCDGGWMLLSYPRFRDQHTDEERREYNRKWMADYRARKHDDVDNPQGPQNPQSPQSPKVDEMDTPAPAPAPTPEKKNTAHSAKPHALPTGLPDFWKAYPLKKAKGQAIQAWNKLKPSDEQVALIVSAIATQTRERQSLHHAGEFVPEWKYPATWLNGECWLDETRQPAAQAGARRAMFEGAL